MSDTSRVDRLLTQLTRSEKIRLTHGAVDPEGRATGYIQGVDRLDIPSLSLVDGPLGVRIPAETSTAFLAPIALAATFDADLARRHGQALGAATRSAGQDALLAPGTNLIRVPQNGRNFEYFSEDPVLSAAMSAAVVSGIEAEDVIATPKHYVANNQETYRASISASIDDRTLRELYLPSFRAAVNAGAGSVMTAYNSVNGTRMSDHHELVSEVLKDEWGFDGYVVSDWYGTEMAVAAARGGLDVEMPAIPMGETAGIEDETADQGNSAPEEFEIPETVARGMPDPATCEGFNAALPAAIEAGELSTDRLDDMVRRVLGAMDSIGLLSGDRTTASVESDFEDLAFEVATRGTVLLKNDNTLPLADEADIAVIGPNIDTALLGGGGSSETTPEMESAPIDGIRARAIGTVTETYGLPRIADLSMFELLAGESADETDSGREPDIDGAVAAAADADVAVVFVRDRATEAIDKDDLRLPGRQDELVERVAAANDRTVVVCNTGGPIELPWRESVAAIVQNWYPGQVHGEAIAAVLYGDVDPGGRLPVTFAPEETYPIASDERRYPGVDRTVNYDEGVFVGYRWFDREEIEPTYAFGHGKSYANFTHSSATVVDESVRVAVQNTSDRTGREVIEAFIRPPETSTIERPVREFAGATSVSIAPGEERAVTIDLDELAFSRYDLEQSWTVDPGEYVVEVGRSSRDIRATAAIER
ncbi:beta-glucosidase [Halalkalirubrum salinum]|uniref:beta-glucosidase n=1 Tax=Halalkalirubrum salinum TaxID=2563889 RepID=UPI0010FB55F2|nr:glycoside hydrolase family 3 C-terminal domain-containing protein [Halalkalirubrum salinum]